MRSRPIFDVVALLARCGAGLVFVAHGWQKIQVGVTATGRSLDAMGAPAPTAAAVYSTFVELLGGAALILGLAIPVAGTLLFLDMAGALIFIHAKHGIFLVHNGKVSNGFELVLLLGLASLLFATGGGGRIALDHRLFGRGRTRRNAAGADDPDPDWLESIRPEKQGPERHSLEQGRPAAGEVKPSPDPADEAGRDSGGGGAGASRRRSKPRLPRKRTVEPPPAEHSGERPIPPAGTTTVKPDSGDTSPKRPRLAAEMVGDTSRDVIVAGKKPEPPSGGKTSPARTRKKPPKSD